MIRRGLIDRKLNLLPGLRKSFSQENIPSAFLASFSSAYLIDTVRIKFILALENVQNCAIISDTIVRIILFYKSNVLNFIDFVDSFLNFRRLPAKKRHG